MELVRQLHGVLLLAPPEPDLQPRGRRVHRGLNGVMVDLRTKAGSKLDKCAVDGHGLTFAGEFNGVTPSALAHAVISGMTMRMIMLSSAGNVPLIEVDDIDSAPVGLPALTSVARQLRFTT